MAIWVWGEYDAAGLNPAVLSAVRAAQSWGSSVTLVMCGNPVPAHIISEAASLSGVARVLCLTSTLYDAPVAERFAVGLQAALSTEVVTHLLAAATTGGKNLLPRLAGMLGVGQVSEAIAILPPNQYKRPLYAGNAIATVESHDVMQLVTIRPTAFPPVERTDRACEVVTMAQACLPCPATEWMGLVQDAGDRPDLGTAKWVVSGGRGLQNAEGFARLGRI